MKIVAIQTSANEDGLTHALAGAALEGARKEGACTELINLNSMDVRSCIVCGSGWGHHRSADAELSPDECVISDDFTEVRQKVAEADGLVFCTPVYFWDLSETAKALLDRLRRTHYPIGEESPFTGKPVVSIAAAGGSGNGATEAASNLETHFVKWMDMVRVMTLPVTRQTAEIHMETAEKAGELLARTAQSCRD